MRGLGAALFADSVHRRGRSSSRPADETADRCDFCESATARWRYPTHEGPTWKACDDCHRAIMADDREALSKRATSGSAPTTFPYRHPPRPRDRASAPSDDFWSNRGVAEPLHA
jgi:hypothetical protein